MKRMRVSRHGPGATIRNRTTHLTIQLSGPKAGSSEPQAASGEQLACGLARLRLVKEI